MIWPPTILSRVGTSTGAILTIILILPLHSSPILLFPWNLLGLLLLRSFGVFTFWRRLCHMWRILLLFLKLLDTLTSGWHDLWRLDGGLYSTLLSCTLLQGSVALATFQMLLKPLGQERPPTMLTALQHNLLPVFYDFWNFFLILIIRFNGRNNYGLMIFYNPILRWLHEFFNWAGFFEFLSRAHINLITLINNLQRLWRVIQS